MKSSEDMVLAVKSKRLPTPDVATMMGTGAASGLCGETGFLQREVRLNLAGLRIIRLKRKPKGAHDVGGSAQPLFDALVLHCFCGIDSRGQEAWSFGVVEQTVRAENIPDITCLRLLEAVGRVIDIPGESILVTNGDVNVQMHRLPAKHRIVTAVPDQAVAFRTPESLLEQMPWLTSKAFLVTEPLPVEPEIQSPRA